MTEINDDNEDKDQDNMVKSTFRSEETDESNNDIRRGVHDTIEKQARFIAEKDFATMERNWDEYMFEHMDENTAKFIILKHVHDGKNSFCV